MDYLPFDPHDKEKIKQDQIQENLKQFRSYVVDKDVAKALVKGLNELCNN